MLLPGFERRYLKIRTSVSLSLGKDMAFWTTAIVFVPRQFGLCCSFLDFSKWRWRRILRLAMKTMTVFHVLKAPFHHFRELIFNIFRNFVLNNAQFFCQYFSGYLGRKRETSKKSRNFAEAKNILGNFITGPVYHVVFVRTSSTYICTCVCV